MPPRSFTNPAPKTESAREAVRSFYCSLSFPTLTEKLAKFVSGDLCSKGYSRMNEYEAHLSSYDHSHKQRLKDMRQLSRDPLASEKARKAEAKANSGAGLISIKLGGDGGATGGGGLKKGGFKKSGFKSAFVPIEVEQAENKEIGGGSEKLPEKEIEITNASGNVDSDTDNEDHEMYDPRHPTD